MFIFSDVFRTNMCDAKADSNDFIVDSVNLSRKITEAYFFHSLKDNQKCTSHKNLNLNLDTVSSISDTREPNFLKGLQVLPTSSTSPDSCSVIETELLVQTEPKYLQIYCTSNNSTEVSSTNDSTNLNEPLFGCSFSSDQTSQPQPLNFCKQACSQDCSAHTELIKQQDDIILKKEKQIILLKKETLQLKRRIRCLQRIIEDHISRGKLNHLKESFANSVNKNKVFNIGSLEDMTEDLSDSLGKEEIEIGTTKEGSHSQILNLLDLASGSENIVVKTEESLTAVKIGDVISLGSKQDTCDKALSSGVSIDASKTVSKSGKLNSREFDPFKNSRMNMRHRRVDSGSGSDSVIVWNRNRTKRFRRSKSSTRSLSSKMLTTKDPYFNQVNIDNNAIIEQEELNAASACTLEVPSWRIKLYSTLYTMEGTENLDDEVYNKRHCRLENDERRRKRWDVQRIREQRVIEKLKQRQQRIVVKGEDHQQPLVTLWPKPEDIKFIEVTEDIPVAAFGHPLSKAVVR